MAERPACYWGFCDVYVHWMSDYFRCTSASLEEFLIDYWCQYPWQLIMFYLKMKEIKKNYQELNVKFGPLQGPPISSNKTMILYLFSHVWYSLSPLPGDTHGIIHGCMDIFCVKMFSLGVK